MDTAQVDEALEKLMLELQHFKRSSELLTNAESRSTEVVAASEAIIRLAEQIHRDNQHQVEAVRDYTTASERGLSTLTSSITDAQNHLSSTLTAFEHHVEQRIEALIDNVLSSQKQQAEALDRLEQSLLAKLLKQDKAQLRQTWTFFAIVLVTQLVASASLWYLLR